MGVMLQEGNRDRIQAATKCLGSQAAGKVSETGKNTILMNDAFLEEKKIRT